MSDTLSRPEQILRRVLNVSELQRLIRQPILVAMVTSGDHPIQWLVYEDYRDWLRDCEIELEPDDAGSLERWNVYELPMSAVDRYRHSGQGAGWGRD